MKVPLGQIVGHLEVEEIELADDELIAEAFIIIRTLHPNRDHPQTTYTSTDGFGDTATQIGALLMVSDKVRADARRNWVGEDE